MKKFINSSIIEKLPVNHFGKLTQEIIELLLNGHSPGIYGIPGYGMNYFAKHITLLIEKKYPKISTILLNLELENNKVEVLKSELSVIIQNKEVNEITVSKFLENSKIVIILTEVHSPNYPKLFKFLCALKELHEKNFTVLSVADYSLFKNTEQYLKHGRYLFTPIIKIDNFDFDGVKRIIKINNEEYNWNIPLKLTKKILFLSGGNPALVYSICMSIYYEGERILNYPSKLVTYQPLNFRLSEIAKLITNLTIEEQIKLGILNNNGTLFAELLSQYLKTNELEGLDTLFPDLTKMERKILTLFIRNTGKVINKDQLSLVLDQTADSYSEWAIYEAIARVRDKIKDKYDISTLKGRGWRMVNRKV